MTIKSVLFNPVRRPGPFKCLLILSSSAKKGRHLLLFRQSSKPTAERHRLVFPTPASAQHQASLVMRTVASLVAGSINNIQPAQLSFPSSLSPAPCFPGFGPLFIWLAPLGTEAVFYVPPPPNTSYNKTWLKSHTTKHNHSSSGVRAWHGGRQILIQFKWKENFLPLWWPPVVNEDSNGPSTMQRLCLLSPCVRILPGARGELGPERDHGPKQNMRLDFKESWFFFTPLSCLFVIQAGLPTPSRDTISAQRLPLTM